MKKRRVYSSFKDNIWDVVLTDMQIIIKFIEGIRSLLCVIDILINMHGLFLWKIKKGITIVSAFQKFLNDSKRKANKIWVDKGSVFFNRPMRSCLQDNNIEMYSTHNEGKSVVAKRFIRTLKNNIYKYTTSISKNVCIDKLDDIVNEYNNTNQITIKMKPPHFKDNAYIKNLMIKILNLKFVIM